MPNPGAFTDAGAYEATLLHELAHWTGHASRLARPFGPRGSDAYAVEELVAELTSAYLCAACGVDGRLQHAEYLGSWMLVIKADTAVLLDLRPIPGKRHNADCWQQPRPQGGWRRER